MNKINYNSLMEQEIENLKPGTKPRLLIHACCAPCSSATVEYLKDYFDLTVYFYNPNLIDDAEYSKRAQELIRFLRATKYGEILIADYDNREYLDAVTGLENASEGGERCDKCFELRLRATAKLAHDQGFDYFATTLTISPLKDSAKINKIGEELSHIYNVKYLMSDFKKKNRYKRSLEISQEYNMYRQNYCGCAFSKAEADRRITQINKGGDQN